MVSKPTAAPERPKKSLTALGAPTDWGGDSLIGLQHRMMWWTAD